MLASFICSLVVFSQVQSTGNAEVVSVFDWINSGALKIPFEFLIDPLSTVFLLVITGIGFLIHVYSTAYMKEDEGFSRYFSYLVQ